MRLKKSRKPALLNQTATRLLSASALCVASPLGLASSDGWTWNLTPYLFAADLGADIKIGEVSIDTDISFDELLENLDSGAMGMLSARNDRWVIALDATYMKLSDKESSSVSGPFGRTTLDGAVESTSRLWIYQPMVGYLLIDDALKLDVYGSLRYTRLRSNLEVTITTSGAVFAGGERQARADAEWTDLVVGTHFRLPLLERWYFEGLADIGTGNDSDLSYQVLAALQWQFSDAMSVNVGYRYLYQDFEKDSFRWEATYSGLLAGLSFRF